MNLLTETKQAFAKVRSSVVDAMQKLYQVKESGEWQAVASSFGEYVESELQISQGFASKLLTVNEHYLLAGVSQEKIAGIDYECLYLAAKTEGTLDEQIEKARTLTRRELKEERNEEVPCLHEDVIKICKACQIRL